MWTAKVIIPANEKMLIQSRAKKRLTCVVVGTSENKIETLIHDAGILDCVETYL